VDWWFVANISVVVAITMTLDGGADQPSHNVVVAITAKRMQVVQLPYNQPSHNVVVAITAKWMQVVCYRTTNLPTM
jgi:hypothetical protein